MATDFAENDLLQKVHSDIVGGSTAPTVALMLQNAVPAKIVSAMLGHSSIGITMDTYSHVLTDMQEGATSKMNMLLKKLY